jgi:glycine reductase
MKSKVHVVHYINQFFAGMGGEEQAGASLQIREGAVGPGKGLMEASAERLEIMQTMVCGDNFFQDHTDEVLKEIGRVVEQTSPDVLIAGPAFNAGRYGIACRAACEWIMKKTGIPTVTAMYKENPAMDMKRVGTYILRCGDSVRDMKAILPLLADFAYRLGTRDKIGSAEAEGYFARGIRRNILKEQIGAARAVEMLIAKIGGTPFKTEIPLPSLDKVVSPAPISDLKKATIVLVTDGGVVPRGNPDRLESARATKWFQYSVAGKDHLKASEYESIHGGFDLTAVNQDPNRVVPVDVMRELEREGRINKLYDAFYSTTGMTTPIVDSIRNGKEIAPSIAAAGANGIVLTGT